MLKIDIFLTVSGLAGAVSLASILTWRKLYREFPFFFTYVCLSIIIPVIRVSVSGHYRLFVEVYWATEVIYALLALLALHEVFRRVLIAFFSKWWFWLLFPCSVIAILAIATIYHAAHLQAQANRVMSLIVSLW